MTLETGGLKTSAGAKGGKQAPVTVECPCDRRATVFHRHLNGGAGACPFIVGNSGAAARTDAPPGCKVSSAFLEDSRTTDWVCNLVGALDSGVSLFTALRCEVG